jgi:hypothetical protein
MESIKLTEFTQINHEKAIRIFSKYQHFFKLKCYMGPSISIWNNAMHGRCFTLRRKWCTCIYL